MSQKILVFSVLFLAVLTFFVAITVITIKPALADASNTTTIDVNVTEYSSISIWPTVLNWTSVAVGHTGGPKNLTIKNVGSINVSNMYAYVDTLSKELGRPYGSSNPKNYSAGEVITLENETDAQYYYAGRIEWNWTEDIPNHNWGNVTSPVAWGYFRNVTDDYVWVVGNGTAGKCNVSDAQFSIENVPDLGTIDTRTPPVPTNMVNNFNDSSWSYFSIDEAGPLNRYCVAVYRDCSKIYIYNFDKRGSGAGNFSSCTNSDYIRAANLVPGDTTILKADAWVPNGYPAGWLNTTILTVYATS